MFLNFSLSLFDSTYLGVNLKNSKTISDVYNLFSVITYILTADYYINGYRDTNPLIFGKEKSFFPLLFSLKFKITKKKQFITVFELFKRNKSSTLC